MIYGTVRTVSNQQARVVSRLYGYLGYKLLWQRIIKIVSAHIYIITELEVLDWNCVTCRATVRQEVLILMPAWFNSCSRKSLYFLSGPGRIKVRELIVGAHGNTRP